jgi:dihydrofolate synthase/folylpolyglutamate synthase
MLEVLAPSFERIYLTCFQTSQRCETPEQLLGLLPETTRSRAEMCTTSQLAWRRARQEAGVEDLICITGSLFLAGELRPIVAA